MLSIIFIRILWERGHAGGPVGWPTKFFFLRKSRSAVQILKIGPKPRILVQRKHFLDDIYPPLKAPEHLVKRCKLTSTLKRAPNREFSTDFGFFCAEFFGKV